MYRRPSLMAMCILTGLLAACSGVRIHAVDQHVKGGLLSKQGTTNENLLSSNLLLEGEFYKTKDKAPCTCIAFSGGGIRSAAFSIGVMKGLHALKGEGGTPFLNQVDILSATSGGGYALSWYYMNQAGESAMSKDDLFGPDAQNYLADHADFMTVRRFLQAGLSNALLIPWNLFANDLFGWHLNTSFVATSTYEGAIRETFHSDKEGTLAQLREVTRERQLPFFVLTTTGRIDEDRFHFDSQLSKTVFEFTPARFGSDAFGYSSFGEEPPLTVSEIAEVSGAAIDSFEMFTGARQKVVGSVLNSDTGRYISNYREKRSLLKKLGYYASFFPFYLYQRAYLHDAYGERMYLSDGGHSDNLAAFPLIRRLCQTIVIVDAEYDPHYMFEAYFKLKHAVEREMHVTFTLDKGSSHDVEIIPEQMEMHSNLTTVSYQTLPDLSQTFDHSRPVIRGQIKLFPRETPGDAKPLEIIYIKMALDQRFKDWDRLNPKEREGLQNNYGPAVTSYALSSVRNTCAKRPYLFSKLWKCSFPQYDTTHQNFAPEQFTAYVELGAHIVRNNLLYDSTKKSVVIMH